MGICFLFWFACSVFGTDLVEMQNGDLFSGKILSLTNNVLLLQSDLLGTIKLPRSKIAHLTLDVPGRTNVAQIKGIANTKGITNAAPASTAKNLNLPQVDTNSALVKMVQNQFLSGASPEAKDKFNELLSGFMGGKLSVEDIRAQAQSAAEQLRAARKDLGNESGWLIDSYLSILDKFVKETTPAPTPGVGSTVPGLKPSKPASPADKE